MSAINTVTFDLATIKTYNEATQHFEDTTLKGNLYTVSGVTDGTGALRKLSMAELVMVICLARAQEKEEAVINLMREMGEKTTVLEHLTKIEQALLDGTAPGNINSVPGIVGTYNGTQYNQASELFGCLGISTSLGKDDMITQIESNMDSLNSFSQQKMIELQSETNKRDQAYDMITNIIKSLNTVQVGIANNI